MSPDLIIVKSAASTNLVLRENHHSFADGSLYCALEQTAGRGRLNRPWITPPGSAVCASAIFKNVALPYHAGAIIALAALEVIKEKFGDDRAYFKWPNDIYIGGEKLAGILSEGVIEQGRFTAVISGIGINVNQSAEQLAQLDNPATSVFCQNGKIYDIPEFCAELFESLKKFYRQYAAEPETILAQWRQANRLLGKKLTAVCPDGRLLQGVFCDIASDGAMLLDCGSGPLRFDCGDIKLDPSSF